MYKLAKIAPNKALAEATKCSVAGLTKIFKKGIGAYYSSGSRPNQTGHSWGFARLASAITGGKSSAVDMKILKESCKKTSKALKLANKNYMKYKKGTRRVKQIKIMISRATFVRHQKGRVSASTVAQPNQPSSRSESRGSDV